MSRSVTCEISKTCDILILWGLSQRSVKTTYGKLRDKNIIADQIAYILELWTTTKF